MGRSIATATDVQVLTKLVQCYGRLREEGLEVDDLQLPIDDPQARQRLVQYWRNGARDVQVPTGELVIFGPEDWQNFYGLDIDALKVPEFPWSDEILNAPCPFLKGKRVQETHFAFLGIEQLGGKPLTIMHWRELHPRSGQPRFYSEDPWYCDEQFATKVICELRWYLMLQSTVPKSENKTYQQQVAMLPGEYEVPVAIAEVTKDLLYFRKAGTCLNPNRYARCQDTDLVGGRVDVGYFDRDGLRVSGSWDGGRSDGLGVAASRKL